MRYCNREVDALDIVVGVTGATGIIYAIRLLQALAEFSEVNTHLIMSEWALHNLKTETDYSWEQVRNLAAAIYDNRDLGAKPASGSFMAQGMVIIPCSMKTLSAVANGYADTLIARAADVTLKEQRKLVVCPRETPLNAIQLENMLKLARIGAVIAPLMPAFYNRPRTIDDLIDYQILKVCDQFGLSYTGVSRWPELNGRR